MEGESQQRWLVEIHQYPAVKAIALWFALLDNFPKWLHVDEYINPIDFHTIDRFKFIQSLQLYMPESLSNVCDHISIGYVKKKSS